MTRDSDLKQTIRARMRRTGENYTAARAALLAQRATDPGVHPDVRAARTEHERLIRPFLRDEVIVQVPARRRARFAVLLELLARFAPGETYDERQVGEVLRPLHEDVAFWRRELVDDGLLDRDPGAGRYRVAHRRPDRSGNMAQEVTDWERVWLPAFLGGATSREASGDEPC